jgi:hypothetical protein
MAVQPVAMSPSMSRQQAATVKAEQVAVLGLPTGLLLRLLRQARRARALVAVAVVVRHLEPTALAVLVLQEISGLKRPTVPRLVRVGAVAVQARTAL